MITLEQYLAARRYWEVSGWILFLTIGFAANVGINWIEIDRSGADIDAWEPVVWQVTSHLALGLLLPLYCGSIGGSRSAKTTGVRAWRHMPDLRSSTRWPTLR